MMNTIKAVVGPSGEWDLWVLAAPYGSPARKDAHGDWFSPQTDFAVDQWPLPPAVYYHGYDSPGRQSARPAYVGRSVERKEDADGTWFRVRLDPSKPYAKTVWDAAQRQQAACSPGTAEHLIRRRADGHLDHWPILEVSVFETSTGKRPANPRAVALPALKAIYDEAGMCLPDAYDLNDKGAAAQRSAGSIDQPSSLQEITMDPNTIDQMVEARVAAAMKAVEDKAAAKAAEEAAIQAEVEKRTAAMKMEFEKQAAEMRRLPMGGNAPYIKQFSDTDRFDNLDLADQALMVQTLMAAQKSGRSNGVSDSAIKALIIKAAEDKSGTGESARRAIKAMVPDLDLHAVKANELNRSDLASYGDEWAGVAWSNQLWEKVRNEVRVAANLPTVEIPQGMESIEMPIDGTSVTFYKIAGATGLNATTGRPDATIPSSKKGTDKKTLTTGRLACRVAWDGALEEDSIIPWVPTLRMDIEKEGAEVFESALIDGDVATGATTNINDIANAGTQTATNYYLLFDGFRKLALVTNTANARDGGTLGVDDVLETAKLLGTSGINGMDPTKVGIIVDALTNYKLMGLTTVLSRDVFGSPTIEGNRLTSLFGYPIIVSTNMCRTGNRLSNTAGKVDLDTPANNTKGSMLAVRWDQWRLAFKRRTRMEVSRFAEADTNQIVMIMRVGLTYRDTEASAISYNLTV